jgi:hypothetical protein
MSALQPAKANDISARTAAWGARRADNNAGTLDMLTHWYATNDATE